jgi:glycosyltransferase involved in cell wall biosynthesis
MKKIAFFVPLLDSMPQSGFRTFVIQMRDASNRVGWPFDVVELPPLMTGGRCQGAGGEDQNSDIKKTKKKGGVLWDCKLGLGYFAQLLREIKMVWGLRRQWRGRVIVVNEFGCETLPVALRCVAPLSRIVAISHTHPGHGFDASHWVRCCVEKACYWSVNYILYNSHASRDEWVGKLDIPRSKGRVIHLGIPPPATSVPRDYPVKKPGVVDFVCVARFSLGKGHKGLIEAWLLAVEKKQVPMRLILIGDGPTWEEMRQFSDGLGLTDDVIFLGARDTGAAYFAEGDVGVLLSNESEAFGLVLLEAMSRKKPVLASNVGGIPEVVEADVTGILVDPFDTDAVSAAILRLAGSEELRHRMGEAGLARWKKCFTAERMATDYSSYFREICKI